MQKPTKLITHYVVLLLMMFIYIAPTSAQETTLHAKFIVQDARKNDIDISKQWVKEGAYLAIYTLEGDNEIYMANVNPKQKSQSYGSIFDLKVETVEETAEQYETETFDFKWSYANSYDDKVGTSTVRLVKVRKQAGVAFTCTIITEQLDVITYKGYMEGSLKNLNKSN